MDRTVFRGARGDGQKTTVVSLGDFSQSFTLSSSDPFQLRTITFTTTQSGQLTFADLAGGNGNIGNILDNVVLASGVPEASTWAMMILGFFGIGLVAYRRSERPRLRLA